MNTTIEKNPVLVTEAHYPDCSHLSFGTVFTDHMYIMEYSEEKGWHNGHVEPYGPLSVDPAAAVFQYGIEMFEGMKAYRRQDGSIALFRPDMNAKRAASSCERLCIPPIPEELMTEGVKEVVRVDQDWVPGEKGTSLYIRPFIIADDPYLGVKASHHFLFVVILSPVGNYYADSCAKLHPTRIYIEDKYSRAVRGGTGAVKIGGNYAGGLKAQEMAHLNGYDQVLWLDSLEKKYVQEIGTSNAFFLIGDTVHTAPLDGTILPGITRDSVIQLLRRQAIPVSEEPLDIDTVIAAARSGDLKEVFASGTAAVISPVGMIGYKGTDYVIHQNETGPLAQSLYDRIVGIQMGLVADEMNWMSAI